MCWIRTDSHTQIEGADDIHLVYSRRTEDFDGTHYHLLNVQGAVHNLEDHVYGRDGLLKGTLRQFLDDSLLTLSSPAPIGFHYQEATSAASINA